MIVPTRLVRVHTVAITVMKNWEPLVLGPAFAMLTTNGLSCLSIGCSSSSNSPPQMDSPPVPVPTKIVVMGLAFVHKN